MDVKDAKAFVNLITAEAKRRRYLLPEDGEAAIDQWMFTDLPFLHDLCVLYLIALRHHIERRLLFFASCALRGGKRIKHSEFKSERDKLRAMKGKLWKEIDRRLQPSKCARYSSVEALQLLANDDFGKVRLFREAQEARESTL